VKPISARIDALIEHKLPEGSNVAISVYDLTCGKPLYGYNADKLSRHASTYEAADHHYRPFRPEADKPVRTEM
jgi:D-alanyl-D-alanine carboxypeptidase (penicillin-binding protein 4)